MLPNVIGTVAYRSERKTGKDLGGSCGWLTWNINCVNVYSCTAGVLTSLLIADDLSDSFYRSSARHVFAKSRLQTNLTSCDSSDFSKLCSLALLLLTDTPSFGNPPSYDSTETQEGRERKFLLRWRLPCTARRTVRLGGNPQAMEDADLQETVP
jgi:hypothetical protein